MYVWLDALINYLSAIGYPDEKYKKLLDNKNYVLILNLDEILKEKL